MKSFHKRGGGGVNRISYHFFRNSKYPKIVGHAELNDYWDLSVQLFSRAGEMDLTVRTGPKIWI